MSWAKVKKINSNLLKSLNEQARELQFNGAYLLTAQNNIDTSYSFTPDKSGWYKVIVVGRGGTTQKTSYGTMYGGSGGVAISTLHLDNQTIYPVKISTKSHNSTDDYDENEYYTSFNNSIIAYSGRNGYYSEDGDRGIAEGGDFNYSGSKGHSPQSVGVYIPGLMEKNISLKCTDSSVSLIESGYGILGYGCSGYADSYGSVGGNGACVLIIPLEFD